MHVNLIFYEPTTRRYPGSGSDFGKVSVPDPDHNKHNFSKKIFVQLQNLACEMLEAALVQNVSCQLNLDPEPNPECIPVSVLHRQRVPVPAVPVSQHCQQVRI